ncbi:uncharacterized protein STEHIDRAFT_120522, partial [Stereum hirsutum FP-91666 SS1]|uniref:uncharacterized protein n=1 Tax=Stereum hirsutum (strain FP-91666) TaxID=721885 RepID=UPI000440F3B3
WFRWLPLSSEDAWTVERILLVDESYGHGLSYMDRDVETNTDQIMMNLVTSADGRGNWYAGYRS